MKEINPVSGMAAVRTVEQLQSGPVTIEICEYDRLKGSRNIQSARNIHAANEAGMKLKFIKFSVQGSAIRLEPGLLHYLKGNLTVESHSVGGKGIGGYLKGKLNAALTGETAYITEVKGSGEVYLEPNFGHYFMVELNHEELIADKGAFVASTAQIQTGIAVQKNISSSILGGEGFFQTKVGGSGIAIFNAPVHLDELVRVDLHEEKLRVDGSFAVLRTASLDFRVEKAARSFYKTYRSGEGFFQTFTGTGSVWLAPTEAFYHQLDQMAYQRDLSVKGKTGSTHDADAVSH